MIPQLPYYGCLACTGGADDQYQPVKESGCLLDLLHDPIGNWFH